MNLKLAQDLYRAVKDFPNERFNFNELPRYLGEGDCGYALFVAAESLNILDERGLPLSPLEMGEKLDIELPVANYLFNNDRDYSLAHGAVGKAEFFRRWGETFGEENVPND